MNLDMPAPVIEGLARRGVLAGENLAWIQRGTSGRCPPPTNSDPQQLVHQWDRHRFTRYRSFVGGLARYLEDAQAGFGDQGDYSTLGQQAVSETWLPYRAGWTQKRKDTVEANLLAMFELDLPGMVSGAPAGSAIGFNPRRPSIGSEADEEDGG